VHRFVVLLPAQAHTHANKGNAAGFSGVTVFPHKINIH